METRSVVENDVIVEDPDVRAPAGRDSSTRNLRERTGSLRAKILVTLW
jgi:hypothetical protein